MKTDCLVGRLVDGRQMFWADHRPLREREEPEKESAWTPHPQEAYWMDKASAADMCFASQGEFVCQYLFNRPSSSEAIKVLSLRAPEQSVIVWKKKSNHISLEEAIVPGTCLGLRAFLNRAKGSHLEPTGATWVADNRFMGHAIEIQTADSLEQAKKDAEAFAVEWKRMTVVP